MATDELRMRRRRTDGERRHAQILDVATRLASVEGVHGLTIGRLAEELGISKSGLYAHFGSKEQLQLEVIEAAGRILEREVAIPTMAAPEGLPRLEAFCDAYFSYIERWVFPGGCFFASLLAEADARPGAVHEVVARGQREADAWRAQLVREAQATGELDAEIDAEQLAFEIDACMGQANYLFVLYRDSEVLARGRRAVQRIIDGARRKRARVTPSRVPTPPARSKRGSRAAAPPRRS